MKDAPPLPDRVQTLRLEPSFGFGDRTGLATPGHVAAMQIAGYGIQPIFPQQSIREMTRTGRTPADVMGDALAGMNSAGWTMPTGADADHLKTAGDIDVTYAAGFSFYTLDPSQDVDIEADHDTLASLRAKFAKLADQVGWMPQYVGRSLTLPGGTRLDFSEETCLRAAVKYGRAIERAFSLADHLTTIHKRDHREYEIELSVDETPQPTTLVEHYIVADQCLRRDMPLVSLAPRFPGDFEKGVDFKGRFELLEGSLRDHAEIAQLLGPYKLSLHSGSDKLSIYAALARATEGRFHVKTAGTSYLEALRVVARHAEPLFREIIDFARACYETDKATYHVSCRLNDVPSAREVAHGAKLESIYLERWDEVPAGRGFTRPGRQILHCTFGSVLNHAKLGSAVRQVLREHAETYREVLQDHFVRHLQALQSGL